MIVPLFLILLFFACFQRSLTSFLSIRCVVLLVILQNGVYYIIEG